ncbi:hypothetical protein BKA62DRAFT_680307 [Auriculariales sp. MPI-PUGE-AT-0066]|nr:hypothetical protein BKA62DRAFT_680307 [Auriculariales sp. MPI-PUGE-AT-0066]
MAKLYSIYLSPQPSTFRMHVVQHLSLGWKPVLPAECILPLASGGDYGAVRWIRPGARTCVRPQLDVASFYPSPQPNIWTVVTVMPSIIFVLLLHSPLCYSWRPRADPMDHLGACVSRLAKLDKSPAQSTLPNSHTTNVLAQDIVPSTVGNHITDNYFPLEVEQTRYVLKGELGAGGYSRVVAVQDLKMDGALLAIKTRPHTELSVFDMQKNAGGHPLDPNDIRKLIRQIGGALKFDPYARPVCEPISVVHANVKSENMLLGTARVAHVKDHNTFMITAFRSFPNTILP